MGGENSPSRKRERGARGSSPRGRGKRRASPSAHQSPRLIPAWAGKTYRGLRGRPSERAHPRAGGENCTMQKPQSSKSGSSPRGRGKRRPTRRVRFRTRLIPARAGKTTPDASRSFSYQAHPRAGGENFGELAGEFAASGSSPRGRGKRTPRTAALDKARLIPARAGKTTRGRRRRWPCPAHPRAGGENSPRFFPPRTPRGSSPRGRGKLAGHQACHASGRLIPARAGKTSWSRSAGPGASAHPRAGGENTDPRIASGLEAGSSPRGRGKRAKA